MLASNYKNEQTITISLHFYKNKNLMIIMKEALALNYFLYSC